MPSSLLTSSLFKDKKAWMIVDYLLLHLQLLFVLEELQRTLLGVQNVLVTLLSEQCFYGLSFRYEFLVTLH